MNQNWKKDPTHFGVFSCYQRVRFLTRPPREFEDTLWSTPQDRTSEKDRRNRSWQWPSLRFSTLSFDATTLKRAKREVFLQRSLRLLSSFAHLFETKISAQSFNEEWISLCCLLLWRTCKRLLPVSQTKTVRSNYSRSKFIATSVDSPSLCDSWHCLLEDLGVLVRFRRKCGRPMRLVRVTSKVHLGRGDKAS